MAEARSRKSTAPFLALVTFIGMGVVIPILIAQVGATSSDSLAVWTLRATVVVSSLRYAWIVGSPVRRPFELVFWLFNYFFFGAAPLVQIATTWPDTTPNVATDYVAPAAIAGFVSACSVITGSFLAGRPRRQKAAEFIAERVDARRVYLLSVIALVAAGIYVASVGVASLFLARGDLAVLSGTSPTEIIIRAAGTMGLLVAFVALIHLRAQRRSAGRKWPVLFTAVVLVTLLTVVNPVSSPRYYFGTVLLAVVSALGAFATVRRFRAVALSAIAAIAVVFPALDTFRRSLDTAVTIESPLRSLVSGDFDAFAQTANTIDYLAANGVTYGEQLLGPLLFWVPRSVWPGKPLDTGVLVAEYKGYNFTNLSAPLASELLINFSWIGLVIGMFALGHLLRRLDDRAELQLASVGLPTVAATVLPFYMLIVYRGSLLQATANLVVLIAASWFVRARHGKEISSRAPSTSSYAKSAEKASHGAKETRSSRSSWRA